MSSSFKQRLGNALNTQLSFTNNQSNQYTPHSYNQQIDTSNGNIYNTMTGAQGIGSTGRKSVNASRINTTIGNTSVLNERVLRISEKINEIHQNIEKGKSGKIEEYEKKVNLLEQQFVDSLDAAEKNFQSVEQRVTLNRLIQCIQIQGIYAYLNGDRQSKEELLRQKKEEIAQREQEILDRFALAEKQRFDIEKKLTKLIDERASAVQTDLQYEARNRVESIEHIKACLKSDFPKLEELIRKEAEDREEADSQQDEQLTQEMLRLRSVVEEEKKAREETEETMIEMFKEMISKIKTEIDAEKGEREQAEEALLTLLEETCAKLNKSNKQMATDFERNSYKANHGLGGAAMKKMQELAQSLYESTPGLQEEIPRNTSKILANVKREDNKAENRAKIFLGDNNNNNNNSSNLRKGGTIEKKDLTIAMSAEDWETKYLQILERFNFEKQETKRLKQNMIRKQERYIDREHEYRKTISSIQQQIKDKSTKPLEIIQEQDENQLLLNGVDPNDQKQQEQMEKERKQKIKNESQINQKDVREINFCYEKIQETLSLIQDNTGKELKKQRSELWSSLDKRLDEIKTQLKQETDKKKENQYDFKEKEKELNEHLETMTQIAQKIDDENRNLMKKNSDLKIQYMSQENDRDLLLRQLIYQKKEHQRLRKQAEEKKQQADNLSQNKQDNKTNLNLNHENSRSQFQTGNGYQKNTMPTIPDKKLQSSFAYKDARQQSQINLSGMNNNNSRRNISLSAANMFVGSGRPKTAAMPAGVNGLRPPTGAHNSYGKRLNTNMTAAAGYGLNFMGQRGFSANLANNPKIKRYEDIIQRLKKMLALEKKSLRMVRTLCSKEIETKNQLEKILRACVDDVKSEIAKKRSENKSIYHKGRRLDSMLDEKTLTQQEREKIIEVLLSQERVLTLLYDKTFPPRPATAKVGLKNTFTGQGLGVGPQSDEDMRQFNYYGQINEDEAEDDTGDVEKLEREIEEVLRNRISTANQYERGRKNNNNLLNGSAEKSNYNYTNQDNIINISKGESFNFAVGQQKHNKMRQESASTITKGGGVKRNLMSAAYRQNKYGPGYAGDETGEIGDDIYEDEESSDGMN